MRRFSSTAIRRPRSSTRSVGPVGAQAKAAATLRLTDLLPTETWQSDAADGLVTTIGVTGHAPLTLRLNDLTPHWLIGGRSGAGKTALLIDLLYGLCCRYSPDDLTLYLLDFKEGVSFREFTPTEREPSWMPHARAVGIESDRAYGLAVLRELDAEMTRRSVLYKDAGRDPVRRSAGDGPASADRLRDRRVPGAARRRRPGGTARPLRCSNRWRARVARTASI